MQDRNSIDQSSMPPQDEELTVDAAIAAVTGEVLANPSLREAVVKMMIAQIMTGKWEWDSRRWRK